VGVVVTALRIAASILVLWCFEIGGLRIDRRHMAGLPVARRARAKTDEHSQDFARVMPAAAHLHQIGVADEVARTHFGTGLKAARAGNHSLGVEVVTTIRSAYPHALDATHVAVHGADRRLEADLDTQALGDP